MPNGQLSFPQEQELHQQANSHPCSPSHVTMEQLHWWELALVLSVLSIYIKTIWQIQSCHSVTLFLSSGGNMLSQQRHSTLAAKAHLVLAACKWMAHKEHREWQFQKDSALHVLGKGWMQSLRLSHKRDKGTQFTLHSKCMVSALFFESFEIPGIWRCREGIKRC